MMVYAFIMQILPTHGGGNENIQVIYSEVFRAGLNKDAPIDEQRELRESQLKFVTSKVCSEYVFKRASSIRDENSSSDRLMSSVESGAFRIQKGNPWPVEKHVIWQAVMGIGFTMVLSPEENKCLAENAINLIVQYMIQIFKPAEPLEEMVLNPEKIATVLHVFLPNGQLLFMNHRVVKQLEKEMNQILNEKK